MKENENNGLNKLTKIVVAILLIAQPVFDIIKTSLVHDIQMFGLSFFEMFNIILVAAIGIIAIIQSDRKKIISRLLILGGIFVVYFGLHFYNMSLFNNDVYPNQNSNILVEFYYIYKTFINPIVLMISLYYMRVDKKYLIRIVQIFSLVISLVIIISNIFHFGYVSYGEEDVRCLKSIFDWFTFKNTYRYSFYELTCRGLYFSANQLSSITFMIMPIILYLTYKRKKFIDYFSLVSLIISMYMIGTKVSTYGVIAVFMMFYVLYFFFAIYNKKTENNMKLKNITGISLIMAGSILLFFFSPRYYELKYINSDVSTVKLIQDNLTSSEKDVTLFTTEWEEIEKFDCFKMSDEEKKLFKEFFNNYSDYMGVSPFIIKSYNSNAHPDFWCNYLKTSKNNDYRVLKTSILNNIYKENNNEFDKYFGLGYGLGFIYTEADYSYQFYIYGIVGCIVLLSGYFIAVIISAYKILKNKLFNIESMLLLSSPAIALFTAQFSGHVLERTMPLLILSIVTSITLLDSSNNKY